ncbi:hypothetical protein A2U01_0062381 [Trifolium medium]|uniref:Uncharacterized protein n=1 Tax=Trifolium medium TaxID=97028 RepID=A0A392RX03_9FABA|nr:hypothetical protein [Trifolium medium]
MTLYGYFNTFEVKLMNLEREDFELCNIVGEKSGCGLWGCRRKREEVMVVLKMQGSEKCVELKDQPVNSFCYGV